MSASSLLPEHQKLIDESAISPQIARDRGYRSVTDPKELLTLGFSRAQARTPGLLTPITDIFSQNGSFNFRPDDPRLDERGKPRKYENPPGHPLILDVPRKCQPYIGDPGKPLWITESSRKADALVSLGFLAVAVTGVWGWRASNEFGGLATLPDLESVAWKGREGPRDIILCFDSDVMTNPHVNTGVRRFGKWIRRRGGKPAYSILPHPAEGKNGVDDYIRQGATRENLIATIETFLPQIVDLDPEPPPPPFPVDVFPEQMRRYIEECAASVPVPAEMIALPLLAEVGGLIGNRAYLHLKRGWAEYGALYMLSVAGPGKNKTAALKHARWPVKQLQKACKKTYTQQHREYEREKARWKSTPVAERDDEPQPPRMRHLFTTDTTLEALAAMLETSPGMVISSDELTGWVKRMNQYREGGDREQYMSIWAAEPMKVDRKSGGSVYVETPVVSVFGGVQPDVVPTLHSAGKVRDGWVERLLPFMPDVPLKTWRQDVEVSTDAYAHIADLFRAIDTIPFVDQDAERTDGEPAGIGIRLSAGADKAWGRWYDRNNAMAAEAGGFLGGFYTKLEAHVARFALILHILENPPQTLERESTLNPRTRESPQFRQTLEASPPYVHEIHRLTPMRRMVSRDTMNGAIALGEFFRGQILGFLPLLHAGVPAKSVNIGVVARLERLIRRKGRTMESLETLDGLCLNTSEVLQGLGNVKKEELTRELDTFTDHTDIFQVDIPTGSNPAHLFCLPKTQPI